MELWFSEQHTDDVKLSIRVENILCSRTSDFQRIDVLETPEFGRILVLDGVIMLTEKDEFIYHEMMTHIPLAVHPRVRDVLVIGAGDGGTLRELCRYSDIEHIDLVEIDSEVIDVSREFLPTVATALDDPRVHVEIADGLRYVRTKQSCYDLVIVDSTDPFGPGEGLFTREFYGNCYNALRPDGILVNQHESPYYEGDAREVRNTHRKTLPIYPINRLFQAHIPTYPSGHWLFGFLSKKYDPLADLDADRWNARGIQTRYYNTDLHRGCFALPNYVLDLLDTTPDQRGL